MCLCVSTLCICAVNSLFYNSIYTFLGGGGGVVIINHGVRVAVCACVVHTGVLLMVHWFVRDCLAAVQQTAAPIIVIHAFRQAL